MNISTLSRTDILAVVEPERLFGTPALLTPRYHELARRWHPDVPRTGDDQVFRHINVLHDQAKHLVEVDAWQIPGHFSFTDGKKYVLKYFKSFDFELGKVYLSDTRVTYVIRNEFADLVDNAITIIKGFKFPNEETKTVMTRYLPLIKDTFRTTTDRIVMIDKPTDLIRMRDLLDYQGGKIDSKHVAWMVSRMLNHASFLEVTGLSHNDFSLDTLFVCPEHHTVCILGGWWYATPVGETITALSQRTINVAPNQVIKSKIASVATDTELVRLTGRELLGNANGIHLANDPAIPTPMINWLRLASNGSPVEDYAVWREKILTKPRRFVKLLVTSSEVYPPL